MQLAAFLFDRYLVENCFPKTRSVLLSEASSFFSNSPLSEVPNKLIPLNEILNEYFRLKQGKIAMDQEKAKLDQEKIRILNLLNGIQDVIDAYNSTAAAPPPPLPVIPVAAPTDNQIIVLD